MVGFKSIWLLLTLLLFAACVPQVKQTECGSNEAFNSSLRTCVPVVGGPSSFINVGTYSPTTTLSRYQGDGTVIPLSIQILNPYAQSFSVTWEGVFNGAPYSAPNTITTTSTTSSTYITASQLATIGVGIHMISAKIRDTSNVVVDEHQFVINVTNNPTPVISTTSPSPSGYGQTFYTNALPQTFSLTVKNNGANMGTTGTYRAEWVLSKSGVAEAPVYQDFATTSPAGSLSSSGFNYPTYTIPGGKAVGSYLLRMRVVQGTTVVDEYQWSFNISYPLKAKVTNRRFYKQSTGYSNPAATTPVIAYQNVPHSTPGVPVSNFAIPTGPYPTTQVDFCVEVADWDGAVSGDGYAVRVDWFVNGVTLVASQLTTNAVGGNEVCLSDSVANRANTLYPTLGSGQTLEARVYDELTGEYVATDLQVSGGYPIKWYITSKEQNKAPPITFSTSGGNINSSCTTTNPAQDTKSNCPVTSDTPFNVAITLGTEDFTAAPYNVVDYEMALYKGGVQVGTICSAVGHPLTTTTVTCAFTVDSYTTSGPFDVTTPGLFQIRANVTDHGSPYDSTPLVSRTLTWNLKVTEANTTPSIGGLVTAASVDEGQTMTVNANITDAQRDNFYYQLVYCTDVACATPSVLTTGTTARTDGLAVFPLTVSQTLSESFLQTITAGGCSILSRNNSCTVNFRLMVTDQPHSAVTNYTATSAFSVTVKNINPLPSISLASSLPITTPAYNVLAGMPFSIVNPLSMVTDTSVPSNERTIRYQWYGRAGDTGTTTYPLDWTAIDSADSLNLSWTPSLISATAIAAGYDNVELMVCVEDQMSSIVPVPNPTDSVCSSATPWKINVKNNVAQAQNLATATVSGSLATSGAETGTEIAVWNEPPQSFSQGNVTAVYTAMIDNNLKIRVKKAILRTDGTFSDDRTAADPNSNIITFDALPSVATYAVKDLSITGTANELYVAYMASSFTSPNSFYPQVRRIDITSGKTQAIFRHPGTFGFDYDGIVASVSCQGGGSDCVVSTLGSGVTTITFDGTTQTAADSITITTLQGARTFTFVTDFCNPGSCGAVAKADQLRDLINNSTYSALMGLRASSAGGVLTISGSVANDYFDSSAYGGARIADQVGQIFVHGGNWYLPFINKSLGGADADKLSFYRGATGVRMSGTVGAPIEPTVSNANLALLERTNRISVFYDGSSYLHVALIKRTTATGKIYKLDLNSGVQFNPVYSSDVFVTGTTYTLTDVQIAGNSTYTYILGDTSGTHRLGVYSIVLAKLDEFQTTGNSTSTTANIFNYADVAKIRLTASSTEGRVFASSQGNVTGEYHMYMARIMKPSSSWLIDCNYCEPITQKDAFVSPYVQFNVAPIQVKTPGNALWALGDVGAAGNENIRDVYYFSFANMATTGATQANPYMGVVNNEQMAFESALTYVDGTYTDFGIYRPPMVGPYGP